MSALYLLIGISLLVATVFLFAFLFAMKRGQYDDDYTPSVRMLFENPVTSDSITEPSLIKENTLCEIYKNNKQSQQSK